MFPSSRTTWLWVWCRLASSSAGSSPVRHKPSRSWKGTLRGDIRAEAAIAWAWRSGHPCNFLSAFGFLPEYNSARAIRCGAAGGRFVLHNSARSGALHGCTGHWDEIWESTICSARCSARRSQYVDFHLLRYLWDRGFRGACLLRCAVFCQLRAGVVAIGCEKNPHGGYAGGYLLGIPKGLRIWTDLIVAENRRRDSFPGHASCHSEKPAPRPGSSLRGAEPPRLRQLYRWPFAHPWRLPRPCCSTSHSLVRRRGPPTGTEAQPGRQVVSNSVSNASLYPQRDNAERIREEDHHHGQTKHQRAHGEVLHARNLVLHVHEIPDDQRSLDDRQTHQDREHALGLHVLIAKVNFDCRQNQKHSPHPEKRSDTVVALLFGHALLNCLLKSVHSFIFQTPRRSWWTLCRRGGR